MSLVKAPTWSRKQYDVVTLSLALIVNFGVFALIFIGIKTNLSVLTCAALGVVLGIPLLYFNFTVLHEATHKNVSKHKTINNVLGHISSFFHHASFRHFLWIHLEHHTHTNHPELDPDIHVKNPRSVWKVLSWGGTLIYYFKHIINHKDKARVTSKDLVAYFIVALVYGISIYEGRFFELLLIWGLPNFLAVILLAYVFDYLPHRPHQKQERHLVARIVEAPRWKEFLQGCHNYHLIHHLWPNIPWHSYRKIYLQKKEELSKAGAHIDYL